MEEEPRLDGAPRDGVVADAAVLERRLEALLDGLAQRTGPGSGWNGGELDPVDLSGRTEPFDRRAEELPGIEPLGSVPIGRSGRHEVTLYLYRCEELKRPYPLPYGMGNPGTPGK